MHVTVEPLSTDRPISRHSMPLHPQPSTSGVELSQTLEMMNRTVSTKDTTTPANDLSTVRAHRVRAHMQLASLCFSLFLAGWNDATTGPLLPRIQNVYNIGFVIVSLIFVFACLGFISGAFLNFVISDRLGFGKVIVIGTWTIFMFSVDGCISSISSASSCMVVACCLEAAAPPFPAFVLGYAVNGIGMALQHAQANGFVASFKDHAAEKMGMLHAAYGAGALMAPLVATRFAQMDRWSFHYLVSFGIAVGNTIILIIVFGLKSQDECLAQIGQAPQEQGTSRRSKFRQIFGLKAVHLLAFFNLVYVGVEVTIGGWIVTYIINVRGGGPSSGYVSAGFFGGLMIGRVALLWFNKMVGERRVLFIYAIGAIGLEFAVWFVPSLIGDAVAVAIVGMLLGPIYPIVMNQSSKILPRWLLTGSIGWIAGFGQAGSAILPFMTGALASKVGIENLQPLLVAMMSLMTGLWWLVPTSSRQAE